MPADHRTFIDPIALRAGAVGRAPAALDTRRDPISVRAQAAMGSLEARQASYAALSDALGAGLTSTQSPSTATTTQVLALVESLRAEVHALAEAEVGRLLDVVDAVNDMVAGSIAEATTLVLARLIGATVGTDSSGAAKVSVDGIILRTGAWSDALWVRQESSKAVRLVTSSGRDVTVTSGAAAGHLEMLNNVLPSLVGGLDGTRSVLKHLGDDLPEPAALLRGVLVALSSKHDASGQVKPFLSAQKADQAGPGQTLTVDAGVLPPSRPVSREQERLGTVHAACIGVSAAAIVLGDATYQTASASLVSTLAFPPDLSLGAPIGFSFGVATGPAEARRTSILTMSSRSTLNDVAAAVNGSGAGVRATTIALADGTLRLSLRSLATSSGTDLSVTDGGIPACTSSILGPFAIDPGRDLGHGAGLGDGVATGDDWVAISGVPSASVRRRGSEVSAAVRSIVYAAGVLVDTSASSASTGPLLGDRDLTSLAAGIVRTVRASRTIPGLTVSGGRASFDEPTFAVGYALDPGGTEARLSALASSLHDLAHAASAPSTGFLTTRLRPEHGH